jgi:glycosyltransferase involved in cell wall biosynthesis
MKYNNMELPSQVSGIFDSDTDQRPVMVTIRCITYNHEPYIRQALDGFVMQKTKFRFEAIVHDDVSTDSTASIIREYAERFPDIIKPIFETENQYSKADGSLTRVLDAATRGKYIAFCEGDDYWTDPFKLQKQVEFLESHSDYSCCLSHYICYNEKLKKIHALCGERREDIRSMLYNDFQFGTCTLLLRSELLALYYQEIQPQTKKWLMGDKPLVLYLGAVGKVYTFKECMGTYRILGESASHSSDISLQLKRARNTIDIYKYFADKYLPQENKLTNYLDGAYLYRAYLIYKDSNHSFPQELVTKIKKYNGSYWKLYVVKLMIGHSSLQSIVYKLSELKNTVLFYIRKLRSN